MDIVRSLTDPIVANLYRRTSDGRTIFRPWGNLGRAYIAGVLAPIRTLTVDASPPLAFNRRQALDNHLRATTNPRPITRDMRSEGRSEGTFAALFFGLVAISAIVQLVIFYRR